MSRLFDRHPEPEVTDRFVGAIDELMREADWSEPEICRKVGLKGNEIQQFRMGLTTVHHKAIIRLVKCFPVNPIFIECGEGDILLRAKSKSYGG